MLGSLLSPKPFNINRMQTDPRGGEVMVQLVSGIGISVNKRFGRLNLLELASARKILRLRLRISPRDSDAARTAQFVKEHQGANSRPHPGMPT